MITRAMLQKRLPSIEYVNDDVDWFWIPVQVAMNLPAADFYGESLAENDNADDKRCDARYGNLLDSIRADGFMDPVYVGDGEYDEMERYHSSKHGLGNGHHRVVAAFDLGYTHLPAHSSPYYQWNESGPTTR